MLRVRKLKSIHSCYCTLYIYTLYIYITDYNLCILITFNNAYIFYQCIDNRNVQDLKIITFDWKNNCTVTFEKLKQKCFFSKYRGITRRHVPPPCNCIHALASFRKYFKVYFFHMITCTNIQRKNLHEFALYMRKTPFAYVLLDPLLTRQTGGQIRWSLRADRSSNVFQSLHITPLLTLLPDWKRRRVLTELNTVILSQYLYDCIVVS